MCKKKKQRIYIAIDLKSFYASVECVERHLDPLTTNLVVADPSRTDKTICLAVTPSLKAYGLSGRSRLFEVVQTAASYQARTGHKLSYLIAPPRMGLYIQYSTRIYSIYLKYISPEDIHVYSIDECFIDVTDYLALYHMDAHTLALTMIKDVLSATGITATAGIGTNLYLAKIAMDIVAKHAKPDEDGVRIAELDEISYRKLLWNHRPLTDFWRIGRGIANRLAQNGIYTMGEIARTSLQDEDWFYEQFGVDAELLIDHAWGYEPCTMADIKSYQPSTNSTSSGQVLSCPYPYEKARLIIQEMTDALVLDLVEKNLVTDSITLHIGYDRQNVDTNSYKGMIHIDHYGRAVPKPAHGTVSFSAATNSTSRIMKETLALFDRIINRTLTIRRINITANHVTEKEFEQLDLFSNPKDLEREQRLQETMISIKKKYGNNAILKGMNLEEGATAKERNEQIGGHKA